MSPADLTNPFGPSCCEAGGECGKDSAMSCGCDPGAAYVSPHCWKHNEPKESGMKLKDYAKWVDERVKPYVDLNYCVIALNGEAGEIAEWFKKGVLRGNPEYTDIELEKELGDVLFYLTRIANIKGWSLKDIMNENVKKLEARYGSTGRG